MWDEYPESVWEKESLWSKLSEPIQSTIFLILPDTLW